MSRRNNRVVYTSSSSDDDQPPQQPPQSHLPPLDGDNDHVFRDAFDDEDIEIPSDDPIPNISTVTLKSTTTTTNTTAAAFDIPDEDFIDVVDNLSPPPAAASAFDIPDEDFIDVSDNLSSPTAAIEISDEAFMDVADNLSPASPPPIPPVAETPTITAPFSASGCPVSDWLRKMGVSVKREWLDSCQLGLRNSVGNFANLDVESKAKLCFGQVLCSDMNKIGAGGVLPNNVCDLHNVDLAGPFLLQVDEVVNISSPLRERYKNAASGLKRCLKLSMTDGVQRVFGMEYRPIKCLEALAPAGFKVVIRNVHVRRGLLMLVPEVLEVLGGSVEELEEARKRLVQEVNKPPRGKRTRNGVVPPLATRATCAAWPQNGVANNNTPINASNSGPNAFSSRPGGTMGSAIHNPVQLRGHAQSANMVTTTLQPVSSTMASSNIAETDQPHIKRESGHHSVRRESGANVFTTTWQSYPSSRESMAPCNIGVTDQPRISGVSGLPSVRRELGQQAVRSEPVELHLRSESGQNSANRESGQNSANRESGQYSVKRESGQYCANRESGQYYANRGSGQYSVIRESGQQSSTETAVQSIVRETAQSAGVVQDAQEIPLSRETTNSLASRESTVLNSFSTAAFENEDVCMLEPGVNPFILNGEREFPFTYMASLTAKWDAVQTSEPFVWGTIKCTLTSVKQLKYKDQSTFGLLVYVDDGSHVSQVLIHHNVVQSKIGYTPEEVTAALSTGTQSQAGKQMKNRILELQNFLSNFEGTMVVELSNSSDIPVALEMNEGCSTSDAWLLLKRVNPTAYNQSRQHDLSNAIQLSP